MRVARGGSGAKAPPLAARPNLEAFFATHLARTSGMFCGILNQTQVVNSHSVLDQLIWSRFSGKCVFNEKMRFVTSKTPLRRVHFWARWSGCAIHIAPSLIHTCALTHTVSCQCALQLCLRLQHHPSSVSIHEFPSIRLRPRYMISAIDLGE